MDSDDLSTNPGPRLPPGVDRRGFLRTTAGGVAVLAFAGVIPAGCAADYPVTEDVELKALTPKEFAVAVGAAASLLGAGFPVEPEVVARRIDRELALVGEPIRGDLKLVLGLLEHLTLLGGNVRRFTSLDSDRQLRYLNGWRDSRFALRRAAFQAIKAFVYFFSYSDRATWSHTGFLGPWTERYEIPVYPVDFGEII